MKHAALIFLCFGAALSGCAASPFEPVPVQVEVYVFESFFNPAITQNMIALENKKYEDFVIPESHWDMLRAHPDIFTFTDTGFSLTSADETLIFNHDTDQIKTSQKTGFIQAVDRKRDLVTIDTPDNRTILHLPSGQKIRHAQEEAGGWSPDKSAYFTYSTYIFGGSIKQSSPAITVYGFHPNKEVVFPEIWKDADSVNGQMAQIWVAPDCLKTRKGRDVSYLVRQANAWVLAAQSEAPARCR